MSQPLAAAILALLAGAALLRYLVGAGRPGRRAADFLPAAALAAGAVHLRTSATSSPLTVVFALPALLVAVGLFLLTLPRLFTGRPAAGGAWLRRTLAAVGLVGLAFSLVRTAQFERRRAANASLVAAFRGEARSFDHRGETWSRAFAALVDRLEAEYPFTEWKSLDWPALRAEFTPRVADAEARQDARAYYRALREMASRLGDGHVGLAGDDGGLRTAEVGGGFGLALAELDDGRIAVRDVTPGGPAAAAGLRPGAVLLEWGGLPVSEAVEKTPYLWAESNPATLEGRRRLRLRFVTRAPVGASVRVRWNLGGTSEERALVATAEPEPRRPSQGAEILFGCAVAWRALEDGLGYVFVKHELPTPRCVAPEEELGRALAAFQSAGAPGLILDLRGNFGGEDATAARFLGFFLPEEKVYERVGLPDRAQRRFLPRPGVELVVRPAAPQWRGPLALLVDGETVSSGEGLPLHLKGRENVVIVGREGTHGSFAINQKSVHLPGGLTFGFPEAQSLDEEGRVQVDSDASGRGGILPDVRVARDEAMLEAERSGRDVVLEKAREVLLRR